MNKIDKFSMPYREAKIIWDNFVENIKYNNRFFSGSDIIKKLENIDEELCKTNILNELILYRARVGNFLEYGNRHMLAPPKELTCPGRCNPDGISYLYLSSDHETAICEVKPHKGAKVTVAEIEVSGKYNFFDIGLPEKLRKYMVPEVVKDEVTRCLMNIINEEFSKVIDTNERIEYLPFQFIVEYVKNKGYAGFLYKSTVAEGINYIIFNQSNVKINRKLLYEVRKIKGKIELLECNTIN